MEYLLGFGIAAMVAACANVIGFDKDRSFYAVVLIVIASYYILFAAMASSSSALAAEALPMSVFGFIAVAGYRRSPWFLVVGLAGHGLFDLVHPSLVTNPGIPHWWPGFCLAYDLTAALGLAWVLKNRRPQSAA